MIVSSVIPVHASGTQGGTKQYHFSQHFFPHWVLNAAVIDKIAEIGGSIVSENGSEDWEWVGLAVWLIKGSWSGDGMLWKDDTVCSKKYHPKYFI